MKDGWYHLVPDSVVLTGLGQRRTLTCHCCGTRYDVGKFTCCAPPKGMASHVWLSLSCWAEDGCKKCARHCQCPTKAERLGTGPLAQLGKQFLAEHGR
jgi:hypothetical protein